jgi:putative ABC transport system substrate-binding protein
MKRREFITPVGGAAALGPLAARAQQGRKRIGFLGTSSLSLERNLVAAFVQSLRELGHVDGEKYCY